MAFRLVRVGLPLTLVAMPIIVVSLASASSIASRQAPRGLPGGGHLACPLSAIAFSVPPSRTAQSTPAQPAAANVAEQRAAPTLVTPAEALPPASTGPTVADPSFAAMLRLWRELHPQGRRAAIRYIATLLGA